MKKENLRITMDMVLPPHTVKKKQQAYLQTLPFLTPIQLVIHFVYETYSKNDVSTHDGSHSKDKPLSGYSCINSSFGANGMASSKTKSGEFDLSSKIKSSGKISLKALK